MAQKRFRREQVLHLLLRHRTLPEIRNSPPSTLHPPRYQTEQGVVELLIICKRNDLPHNYHDSKQDLF